VPDPFLDLSALTTGTGERGLLGLAFHPDWDVNGRFWVDYTDLEGNTVIAEYVRSAGDPDLADPSPVRELLTVEQPFANHNGGMLAFGPDGRLYIGLGDGGGAGDPLGNAQNLASKLGKLLRVDVDGYPTPVPGNLTGGDPHIWDYGLRNPWRFSFDRLTGDLYIGDVGQSAWEEIDVERAGDGRRNYGWNILEGPACFSPATGCDPTGTTFPADQYDHTAGECSVVGGYVYRGASIPCLQGWYLHGDYCTGGVRAFFWDGVAATRPHELTANVDPERVLSQIVSFGEDASGELYVVDPVGRIYRIDPR
jgi:glucose/arabinose dehydrogenase